MNSSNFKKAFAIFLNWKTIDGVEIYNFISNQGYVNTGDQNVMQYGIKDLDKLSDPAKSARFKKDIDLTNLLP